MNDRFAGTRRDPKNAQYCTELELHLFQWFEENQPNEDIGIQDRDEHSLIEHVHGYESQRDAYVDGSEQEELMDAFLRIAKDDINGGFEYSPNAFETIIKAITTFGL